MGVIFRLGLIVAVVVKMECPQAWARGHAVVPGEAEEEASALCFIIEQAIPIGLHTCDNCP